MQGVKEKVTIGEALRSAAAAPRKGARIVDAGNIESYLPSALGCLLINPIFGLLATSRACECLAAKERGELARARRSSRFAFWYVNIGVITTLLIVLYFLKD